MKHVSVALLLAVVGCGGGSDAPSMPSSMLGTLAYVVTQCHEGPSGLMTSQKLLIREGGRDPVTAFEVNTSRRLPALGLCPLFGSIREGSLSTIANALVGLAVTPDGSEVVFEITDEFALAYANQLVSPELEGIYVVRADGSHLRRLGPASRQASFRLVVDPASPSGFSGFTNPSFSVSPTGQTIAFVDIGVGPSGEDALQIFIQDLTTGERTQITHFPFSAPTDPLDLVVATPIYANSQTILVGNDLDLDGSNPDRQFLPISIGVDGTNLHVDRSVQAIAQPNGQLQPRFSITPGGRAIVTVGVPGTPENATDFSATIQEVFVVDGMNTLQLTNFRRTDTGSGGAFISVDGQRVFFPASANPLGTNPTFSCQLFSAGVLGGDLRQLTRFAEGPESAKGCQFYPGPGCTVATGLNFTASQDARTGTIIFDSSCDPFGTNPNGDEIFAINPDGSGLRQLTTTSGTVTNPDGSVSVELPGPYAYGPYQ